MIYNNSSGKCECGDTVGGNGIVACDSETLKIAVLYCYCMTYNDKVNQTFVGKCPTMCKLERDSEYISHNMIYSNTTDELNNEMCKDYSRRGQLCGDCMEGYGPPVYSYSLKCVKCKEEDFKWNLLKYIAIAFVPLTIFYFIIIMFRLSVTTGSMAAFVLTCQILTIPSPMRLLMDHDHNIATSTKIFISFFSLWNLDIFRSLYDPFCIHPKMNTLQANMLDYVVGVYPLCLIFLTYLAVILHDRYVIVARLWKPVSKLFALIRRESNIRGSLITAFATFLVLSYEKILNVSFDILTPATLYTIEGKQYKQLYLYSDGEIPYFGRDHIPYGVIALIMLTIFNILPMVVLFLYPCRCIQKCISHLRFQKHFLHTLMDAFQGCYRFEPWDCRYFAALYMLLRIIQLASFAFTRDLLYTAITAVFYMVYAGAVFLVKPYRVKLYNNIDGAFFLLYGCLYSLFSASIFAFIFEPQFPHAVHVFFFYIIGVFPVSYGFIVLVRVFMPDKLVLKIKTCFHSTVSHIKEFITSKEVSNSIPHQSQHENENSPLLSNIYS